MDFIKLKISETDKRIHLFHLELLNEYLDRVDALSVSEVDFLKRTLPELIGILPSKIENINEFNLPFERLVINKNNKRLTNLTQLRYPPREIAKDLDYNRASLKGQTIFYGGSNGLLPIVVETQPMKGQLITTSKWKLKKGYSLKLLVLCQDEKLAIHNRELLAAYNEYNNSLRQLQPNTREVIKAINSLIIKAFTRKVNPNNKQGYLFSALFSDLFFNHFDYPIDAIYYPSVPNQCSAMNIAIKPDIVDSMFTMIEAKEAVIMKNPEPNIPAWVSFSTGICNNYDERSLILKWDNQIIPDEHEVNSIIKEFNIDIS